MWYYDSTIIQHPKAMLISTITYPAAIFRNKTQLTSLGIKPYSETRPDRRYYWDGAYSVDTSGAEVVGTYAGTARDLPTLRTRMLTNANQTAANKHSKIDWYWTRAAKGGTAVPSNIATYATALYSEHETIKTAIAACNTMAKIVAYEAKPHTETRKIKHTSEEGVETYGPETTTTTRHIDMSTHFSVNPTDAVDPAFVSLVAD